MVDPAKRVVINELVCEGCGDCAVQSNCLSRGAGGDRVRPQAPHQPEHLQQGLLLREGLLPELRHGRRRAAEEAEEGEPGAPTRTTLPPDPRAALPLAENAWGIVVAGVGGTGVITIGQLLGMAAHLEGKGVVTQDAAGLAQKGGATWSHIQIANRPDAIYTTKVDTAKADLVIACDRIVAAGKGTLAVMREGRTYVALNTHATPTAAFVGNPDWQIPAAAAARPRCRPRSGRDQLGAFDAEQVAVQLLGDSIYTNPLLLGYAWQQGRVPLSRAALMRAIELNGVQVDEQQGGVRMGPALRARPGLGDARCSRRRR